MRASMLLWAASAQAALTYCSSQNSGADFQAVFGKWQSNGACSDTCSAQNYAFAILQGQQCWCSNDAPGETASLGSCSEDCAGYPTDKCGNKLEGLFGYIQLGQASGTMAASSSTTSSPSSTSSSSSSTKSSSTPASTSTTESSSSSSSPSSTSTTESSTSSSESSTSSTSSTEESSTSTTSSSTTSSPSISVLTVVGGEKTVTISQSNTPSPTSTSSSSGPATSTSSLPVEATPVSKKKDDSFFDHTGKVAGVFTVVGVVSAALIAAVIYWLFRKNKRRYKDEDDDDDDELTVGSGGSPTGSPWRSKNAAVAGVVGRSGSTKTSLGRAPSNGKLRIDEQSENGSHMMREQSESSILGSMGMDAARYNEDASPVGSETNPGRSMAANMSQVHEVPVVDQRLDPSQMVLRYDGANESRHSLQDDADYSRRILRVTNPDYFG